MSATLDGGKPQRSDLDAPSPKEPSASCDASICREINELVCRKDKAVVGRRQKAAFFSTVTV